jgi:hypothetical protein
MGRKYKTTRPRLREVIAEGELRQEPDWDRFAWALLTYVKLRREEAERTAKNKSEPTKWAGPS